MKILKVHPETVNRRTDNAMTKRKRTNNDLQTLHNKLNIEKWYRNKTGDELRYPERVRFGHFQQYFSYTVAISFIVGGNQSTRRKPLICHKSLTNLIT